MTIADDITTTQDFKLVRPAIEVAPATLSVANDCGETLDEQVVTVRPVPPVRLFVCLPLVMKNH